MDTIDIIPSGSLDNSLLELTERLARNAHEVWARQRKAEGWTYGKNRDDRAKHHPNLVPYATLSEGDKEVDRATALETLKLVVRLGFQILPPAPPLPPPTGTARAAAGLAPSMTVENPGVLESVRPVAGTGLAPLVTLWRLVEQGSSTVEDYRTLGARALELGEFLLAFDILKAGLTRWDRDVRLRQLQAQALARSGASESAVRVLLLLRNEGHHDEETLATLARAYKDQWLHSTDPAEGRPWLDRALAEYEASYRVHGGYWSGINAATLAVCSGEMGRARELAAQVRGECLRLLETDGPSYWLLATLGEAALVAGDFKEAEKYYAQVWRAAEGKFANISSTRRNAKLLLRYADRLAPAAGAVPEGDARALLDRWMPLPCVAVFSGHMIDRPGRPSPRFPAELEADVVAAIREGVAEFGAPVAIAYASGACGSDILFLEAMLERGAEVNVVLPSDVEQFLADSVTFAGGDWEQRFRAILDNPRTRLNAVSEQQRQIDTDGLINECANLFIFGLAGTRAWQLGAQLAPLAVWDGRPGDGRGGTADTVAHWRARGYAAKVIDLTDLLRRRAPGRVAPGEPAPSRPPGGAGAAPRATMQAMLFADMADFSKLTEAEVLRFAKHFMHPVADLVERSDHRPVQKNSWGDGLYFVFADAVDAGMFALELHEMLAEVDWEAKGFRWQLQLRTALHVGPVYEWFNPLTKQTEYIGTHVSRAARLEPVTPPGQVYASEIFAAIAFAQGAAGFRCEYVGRLGMAKDYGTYPTYHVRRAARRRQG